MTSMLTSNTNALKNAQSPPDRFPLARCLITRSPQPTGSKVGKGLFTTHADTNLSLLVSTVGPRVMLAIFKGTTTLLQRHIPDHSAPEMGIPNVGAAGSRIMFRFPTTPGFEEVCQVTFPNEQLATMVMTRLAPYTAARILPPTAPAPMAALEPSAPATQPVSQGPIIAQPTPVYRPATSRVGPHQQSLGTTQVEQLESQALSRQSPYPVAQADDAGQSQGFVETQHSSGDRQPSPQTQATPSGQYINPKNNAGRPNTHVFDSGPAVSEPNAKKRKIDADGEQIASSPSKTSDSTTSTKFVADLLDFDEPLVESAESLAVVHPPLDPYEGTPWGAVDRFSSSGSMESTGGVSAVKPNRFITAGLYGMNEMELGEMMDEIITETGFQSICECVARVLDGRRQMNSIYQYEMDEGF